MRSIVDETVKNFEASDDAKLLDSNFDSAFRLMTSPQAREAFDLDRASRNRVRERYGMNRFGQCCLLARRLIEAGVRFVTLNTFLTVFDEITWDIHGSKPFTSIEGMRNIVAPMYDQAYQRPAGRPVPARHAGQDAGLPTWPSSAARRASIRPAAATIGRNAGPSAFAGGGVKGGRIVGRSDQIGGVPAERPSNCAEVVGTIYHSLGLNLETKLPGPQGRPFPLVDTGKHEIQELF